MLIYLASPYSSPNHEIMEERFKTVCKVAGMLMQKGYLIFCPIAHSHPIAVVGGLPREWEYWAEYDRVMITACDEVLVCCIPGWRESAGVTAEILMAEQFGMPVKYLDPVTLTVMDRGAF